MNPNLMFLSNFLKKPKEVAALVPSSRYVAKKVMQNIDFRNAKCIVEYGPGVGTITRPILKNLNPDARLICFELNKKFYALLSKDIRDKRFLVINDTAENIDLQSKKLGIDSVDYVLSSIPFSLIKKENKKSIIKKTENILRYGGKFIVYQQYNLHLEKYLKIYFSKVSRDFEVRNIPPTVIYVCEKI